MGTKWKITSVSGGWCATTSKPDSEERELEKLSKGATCVAREDMKRIDAQKAQDCRQQMLKELREIK